MNDTATITPEPIVISGHRSEGATITEHDCLQIDLGSRRRRSRFKSAWLTEVVDQIDRLARLPAGWDSYGADRPDVETVSASRSLIECIADPFRGLPRPTVVMATRSGGIQFEWGVHGGAYFELEFVSPTCVEYLFVDRPRHIEVEVCVDIQNDSDFIDKVAKYIRDAALGGITECCVLDD